MLLPPTPPGTATGATGGSNCDEDSGDDANNDDDAEEEDIKEAVLTYALLLRHGHLGLDRVKYEAERFLMDEFGVACAFDIEDGCVHLRKLGLLVEDEHGAPRIRDLEDAYEHLVSSWQAAPLAA